MEFDERVKAELVSIGFQEKEGQPIMTASHAGTTYGVDFEKQVVFYMEGMERVTREDDPKDAYLLRLQEIIEKSMRLSKKRVESEDAPDHHEDNTSAKKNAPEDEGTETYEPEAEIVSDSTNLPAANTPTPQVNNPGIQAITYSEDQVQTIKNTVAKGANDNELSMFLHICRTYGLDPFLKEIFYSSDMKTIMTSRDGYLKVAQRDPSFKGIKSAVVHENDNFTMDIAANMVEHSFGAKDRGDIVGAWAIVEREGREPVIQYAPFDEYNKGRSTWKQFPSAMICKCAEALALKRQFGISGLVTQEEVV
jgi:phage recombination protein Bet